LIGFDGKVDSLSAKVPSPEAAAVVVVQDGLVDESGVYTGRITIEDGHPRLQPLRLRDAESFVESLREVYPYVLIVDIHLTFFNSLPVEAVK